LFDLFIFTDDKLRAFEFIDLILQRVEELKSFRLVTNELIKLLSKVFPSSKVFAHYIAQLFVSGKIVEQFEMGRRIEQRLLIALPMNINQKWSQLFEQRLGRELMVDEDLVASGCRQFAAHNQFERIVRVRVV